MKHALLFFVPLCLTAQTNYFTAVYEATLAGVTGATSLQQPSAPEASARLIGMQMYASVNTTFILEQGQKATSTASSAIATVPIGQTIRATLRFFIGSNSPPATVPINKYVLNAGETKTVMFTEGEATGSAIGSIARSPDANYTVRTSAITGDVKVTWFWSEQ